MGVINGRKIAVWLLILFCPGLGAFLIPKRCLLAMKIIKLFQKLNPKLLKSVGMKIPKRKMRGEKNSFIWRRVDAISRFN